MKKGIISIVKYENGAIYFTDERTNEDYFLCVSDSELEEFALVEDPCEVSSINRWVMRGGFVPEVVIDFILHSRNNWQLLLELENAN